MEEVQDYISIICTCAMPNADTSPTLHKLVQQFQVHKCNKYCTKSYKSQGVFYKKCRFVFPRPAINELKINDVIDCMAISKNNKPRKRLYHLPRNDSEQYINDYNPALLLANQANVVIQYIGHLGSRLPYYITDYITKHERSEQDAMWQDIFTSSKSLGANAMSFLMKSIKNRQVGAKKLQTVSLVTCVAQQITAVEVRRLGSCRQSKTGLKTSKGARNYCSEEPRFV